MISEDMLQLITSVAILLLAVSVLIYYFNRSRVLNDSIKEASEIVETIVIEMRNRMKVQESKIMDQEVKLEILELKMNKISSMPLKDSLERKISPTNMIKERRPQSDRKLVSKNLVSKTKRFTETEERALDYLSQRVYTVMELQSVLSKTREHTSRVLNKLYREGYINRDEGKRPFVYFLTDTGKSISV